MSRVGTNWRAEQDKLAAADRACESWQQAHTSNQHEQRRAPTFGCPFCKARGR